MNVHTVLEKLAVPGADHRDRGCFHIGPELVHGHAVAVPNQSTRQGHATEDSPIFADYHLTTLNSKYLPWDV